LLAAAAAWTPDGSPDPACAQEAVAAARATGDPLLVAGALDAVGTDLARRGRYRAAYRIAAERVAQVALADRREPRAAAEILEAFHFAWLCALATGDLAGALDTARTIAADDLLGAHPYRPASKLIPPLVLLGHLDEALGYAEPMWSAWRRSGVPVATWVAPAASAVALACGVRGDADGYRRWRDRAGRAAASGLPGTGSAFAAFVDAHVAAHRGDRAAAPDLVRHATAASGGWASAYARAAGAELAVVAGLPDAADLVAAARPAVTENDWAAACLARAAARLAATAAG
jgi:hypothetical protein